MKSESDGAEGGLKWSLKRWSIRGMLVLTAIVAVPLALYVNHDRRPSAQAVATFRKLGAYVIYDYQQQEETGFVKVARLLGEDYFGSVVSIRSDAKLNQQQLAMLGNLPSLKRLILDHTSFEGTSWEPLSKLVVVEELSLWDCTFGDDDIDVLRPLKNLKSLTLSGTTITDEGLAKLADLAQLKSLFLLQTMTTAEGFAELRAALPKCRIQEPGTPAVLAAVLKMPDGRRVRRYDGTYEVRLAGKGRSIAGSGTNLRPGHLWFSSLIDVEGTARINVSLGNRYQGTIQVPVTNGQATPRYVEIVMQEVKGKVP